MPDVRLIDANEFRKRIIKDYRKEFFGSVLWNILDDMPTIDAVPVVHGRWMFDRPNHYKCSECDAMWSGIVRFMSYCPNCGAKMDGGSE